MPHERRRAARIASRLDAGPGCRGAGVDAAWTAVTGTVATCTAVVPPVPQVTVTGRYTAILSGLNFGTGTPYALRARLSWRWMLPFYEVSQPLLRGSSAQDLSMLCWALVTLGQRPLTPWLSTLLVAAQAGAQSYPSKPVRILVGFIGGSTTDIIARGYGQKLAEATVARTGHALCVIEQAGRQRLCLCEHFAKAQGVVGELDRLHHAQPQMDSMGSRPSVEHVERAEVVLDQQVVHD